MFKVTQQQLIVESEQKANNINSFLYSVGDDVLFLSKSPAIQNIIRARTDGVERQDNKTYEVLAEQLQKNFIAMMQIKPHYMQLRYIDEQGNEWVRVDFDGKNIKLIPKENLQNKADRPYFKDTMKLSVGNLYVSPVNLNQEKGRIERPFKPTIRYATPLIDSAGKKRGIVIANIFANKFIKIFKEEHDKAAQQKNAYPGKEDFIINQDGYYISHPNPSKEWGFEFRNNEKIARDYSEKFAQQILGSEQGFIEEGKYFISYHKVKLSLYQPEFLVVYNQVPKSSVFATVNLFRNVSFGIILVSLAMVLPLTIFGTRQVVNLIKQLVNVITASSDQTLSTLAQQERVSSQQAVSVNETTCTMDELEVSFRQSVEQAQASAAAAQEALQLAKTGIKIVEENLKGMFTLEKKVETLTEHMMHLGEQANQISIISELVSNLASKTNILALNSTVEAIRAGEHGKGFAIIANEIRQFSDQSQKSAEKIYILVSNIQKAINSAVLLTEEGTKTVNKGLQLAQTTDQTFSGMADSVNHIVLSNQQILLNLKQQLDAVRQVVEAMNNINQGAKETVIGISQTRYNTKQLNQTALNLRRIV
ncbi:methyl-accepting chemotaxis protein [Aetokthonos hydrillicola]|uniref:methyl-accepting chemotaxis protein n=1 Tax=Aetokthonos hydrillicola TaxID=1550245 RepID=UPI0030D8B6F5